MFKTTMTVKVPYYITGYDGKLTIDFIKIFRYFLALLKATALRHQSMNHSKYRQWSRPDKLYFSIFPRRNAIIFYIFPGLK